MYSAPFFDGGVTDHVSYDVSLERALIGADLRAFACDVETPLYPNKDTPANSTSSFLSLFLEVLKLNLNGPKRLTPVTFSFQHLTLCIARNFSRSH
uniref:Uncharacterized protein n=1 Tax=Rhipicephalus zambeziensis TaxID=60191 RepID=A0A224Y8G2_9ACAR